MAIIRTPLPVESCDEAAEWLTGTSALDYDLDLDDSLDCDPLLPDLILTTENVDGPGRGAD